MKIKFLVSMFIFFLVSHISMKASEEEFDEDISDSYEEIIEYKKRDVSVSSSMTYELIQMFTHEIYRYKDIEYGTLYDAYKSQMLTIVQIALNRSELSKNEILHSKVYKIIGDEPIWFDEPLFDCKIAKETLLSRVQNFIDANEAAVRSKCIPHVLQANTSKVIWAPCDCDLQLHKDCFKQCQKGNMQQCMNTFCTTVWNDKFYAERSKRTRREDKIIHHFVKMKDVRDEGCPLCKEPLRIDDALAELERIKNKRGLIIDKDGTTSGGKKTRFL